MLYDENIIGGASNTNMNWWRPLMRDPYQLVKPRGT